LFLIDIKKAKNWKIYSSFISKHFLLKKIADRILESQLFIRSGFLYYKVRKHFFKVSPPAKAVLSDTTNAKYWYDLFRGCVERLRQKNNVAFLDDELNWQDFYEYWNAFRDLADYCKEHSVRLILLLTPVLSDFSDYKYLPLHEYMHKLAERMDVEVMDTLDSFREKYKDPAIMQKEHDMGHFNAAGHFIVAEAIEEYLERTPGVSHAGLTRNHK